MLEWRSCSGQSRLALVPRCERVGQGTGARPGAAAARSLLTGRCTDRARSECHRRLCEVACGRAGSDPRTEAGRHVHEHQHCQRPESRRGAPVSAGRPRALDRAGRSTFRRLAEIGPTVFLGDVPRPDFRVPDCLGVHRLDPAACARDLDLVHPPALVAAEAQAARVSGVWFFDPGPSLCPDGRCTWIVDGRLGWVDDHHLSTAGVMALLPTLEPLFDTRTLPRLAGDTPNASP